MTHDPADAPLCVRCAESQRTCCQTREIYTTPGDVERIAAHVGRRDFTTFVVATGGQAAAEQDDDPPWRDLVFRPDGARRVLVRRPSGDCHFLGSAGCVLPLETRPLVCRLYPFDYDHTGLRAELSHDCPTHLMRPGASLLRVLDMHETDGERWRARLYEDLELEKTSEDRPDLRPAP